MESSNFYVISDIVFDDHQINMNYLDFNGKFTPDSLESHKFNEILPNKNGAGFIAGVPFNKRYISMFRSLPHF